MGDLPGTEDPSLLVAGVVPVVAGILFYSIYQCAAIQDALIDS